jgi:hypothetical protein
VALLISEQQLSSLTYNLNLNPSQEMKKMKERLPNKTTQFKTSSHVDIQTQPENLLHDFDKTPLKYQSSCKKT